MDGIKPAKFEIAVKQTIAITNSQKELKLEAKSNDSAISKATKISHIHTGKEVMMTLIKIYGFVTTKIPWEKLL